MPDNTTTKMGQSVMNANEEMAAASGANPSTARKLLKNDLVVTLILMGLVVVGVLIFREILAITLRTDYPLHTPISTSMQPTLNVGDYLIVQGVEDDSEIYADREMGDIIVFRKPTDPDEFIVHRVIEKTWNEQEERFNFKTKGDNNRSSDPWSITVDDIIGKVVWKIPLLGYIKIFLGTQIGMVMVVILFLILILLEGWK